MLFQVVRQRTDVKKNEEQQKFFLLKRSHSLFDGHIEFVTQHAIPTCTQSLLQYQKKCIECFRRIIWNCKGKNNENCQKKLFYHVESFSLKQKKTNISFEYNEMGLFEVENTKNEKFNHKRTIFSTLNSHLTRFEN